MKRGRGGKSEGEDGEVKGWKGKKKARVNEKKDKRVSQILVLMSSLLMVSQKAAAEEFPQREVNMI